MTMARASEIINKVFAGRSQQSMAKKAQEVHRCHSMTPI
jgi:hypothetical protein